VEDPQNDVFIMNDVIYEKKVVGNIQVTDSLLNKHPPESGKFRIIA